MADEFQIELSAIVDTSKIQEQLNGVKDLSIKISKIEVDQSALSSLQTALNNMTKNNPALAGVGTQIGNVVSTAINHGLSNIKTNAVAAQAQQAGKQAGQAFSSGLSKTLLRSNQKLPFFDKPIKNKAEISNLADDVKRTFRELVPDADSISVSDIFSIKGAEGDMKAFEVSIKHATGEMERLVYQGKEFKGKMNFTAVNGKINDSGVEKQLEQMTENAFKLQEKVKNLQAQNPNMKIDTSAFDKAIHDYENGVSTLHEVQQAFNDLQRTVKETSGGLHSRTASLDPVQQAINNIRDFPQEIKGIQDAVANLTDPSGFASTVGNTTWIENLKNEAKELQDILAKNQGQIPAGDQSFIQRYQALADAIAKVNGEIKAQQGIEKNDSSSFAKQQVDAYNQLAAKLKEIVNLKNKLLTSSSDSMTGELLTQLQQAREEAAAISKTIYEGTDGKSLFNTDLQKQIEAGYATQQNAFKVNFAKQVGDLTNSLTASSAKWQEQGILVGDFQAKVETLKNSLQSVGSIEGLNQLREQFTQLSTEGDQLFNADKISDKLAQYEGRITSFSQKLGKMAEGTEAYNKAEESLHRLQQAYAELSDASKRYQQDNSAQNYQVLTSANQNLIDQLNQTKLVYQEVAIAANQAVDPLQLANTQKSFEGYWARNTKAARIYADQVKELREQLAGVVTKGDQKEFKTAFANLQTQIKAEGNEGTGLLDMFKGGGSTLMRMAGIGSASMFAAREARQMIENVKQIDVAETELRKITGASRADISAYFDQAAESAKKYGTEIQNVISATSDWSRLGYNLEDAKELADATTKIATIGSNMTTEKASEGLISTLKGFSMGADQVEEIVDVVSKLENTEPIDSAGLFEGLQRSAASLNAAGATYQEAASLITSANAVVQDPMSVGNTLKTMVMRMRGKDVPIYNENYRLCYAI